jgi:hypothetical protein
LTFLHFVKFAQQRRQQNNDNKQQKQHIPKVTMKHKYDHNNIILSLLLVLVLVEYFPEAIEGDSNTRKRNK